MAINALGQKITLVGGSKAALVNPLGLIKQFKAICITEHVVLSDDWRNTKAEARRDAADHILKGHFIDYDVKIVG
ncbi:MAG TPA: hypothetical protein VLJ68_07215 [Chitinophagaceae bacterium]|nr:hypothetical protein [Chitinophagaceae bacterium]